MHGKVYRTQHLHEIRHATHTKQLFTILTQSIGVKLLHKIILMIKEFLPTAWLLKCLRSERSFLLEWPWPKSKRLYKPHVHVQPDWYFSHTTGTGLLGDLLAIWTDDMLSYSTIFSSNYTAKPWEWIAIKTNYRIKS